MATSLFSNLLYAKSNESNDTDQRDTNSTSAAMSDQERQEIISLLRASTKCIEEGTCDAVIYQTMGALHRYTAVCAGLVPSDKVVNLSNQSVTVEQQQQPPFVMQQNDNGDDGGSSSDSNSTNLSNSEHEDALAYGWVKELSSGKGSKPSEDVAWNSVLALLVQKELDDEPCLWITKEVIANPHDRDSDEEENRDETDKPTRGSATELEILHSIPLRRRLRSCRYQNFYGDHRVVVELKRFGRTNIAGFQLARQKTSKTPVDNDSSAQQIVLRCPSAGSAKAWVECLTEAKKKSQIHASDAAIELEMIDESASFSTPTSVEPTVRTRNTARLVNVIDVDDYAILETPGDVEPAPLPTKRLAEQLQEAEDRKRALKQAVKQAAAFERIRQQQEEEEASERKRQQKLEAERSEREKQTAIEKARLDAIEQKKEEEFQRKRLAAIEKNVDSIVEIEKRKIQENKLQREKQKQAAVAAARANISYDADTVITAKASNLKPKPMTTAEKQQLRMEREIAARKRAEEERRRIEIEYEQKKKKRVEQRRGELEAKRKAAREEQRRKDLIQKKKFLESEQRKEAMKAAAMNVVPKKAVSGVFTKKPSAAGDDSNDTKNGKKGDLWSSLDKQMSAFEAADEERKRKEAEKREEEKAKAEAQEKEEDPEYVRKRIAEEARQKLVQEEAEKLVKGAGTLKKKQQTEAAKSRGAFKQQQNGQQQQQQQQQQRSTSPHPSTSTSQTSSQHRQTHQHSATTPAPAHQQHHNVTSNPKPSVPPLQHPHTQSWNKMQQPPHPSQQAHFQRVPQPTGENHMQPSPRTQGFHQQQHPQPSNGSFVKPLYPTHPMPPQSKTQIPSAQPQPPPRAAPQPAMPQQPQPAISQPQTNGESSESEIKKSVLINWGLQPPAMQTLKPVDQLLCSIHSVFPPSFGVPAHEYFQGWQPISRSELVSSSGVLEETKLKKTVRKTFLCKLLWDLINDAFEEHKKSKEDLDWM